MTDQTTKPAQPEPAAEYTPDWPAIVNRLSAELEEEREARKAWRRRAEAAKQEPATDQTAEIERLREKHLTELRHADEINGALMKEVQRYAAGTEQPVLWSVYNEMHKRALDAEAEVKRLTADRAAVLRGAADVADDEAARLYDDMGQKAAAGARLVGDRLRRMADETRSADMRAWQQEWDSRPNGADVSDLIEITAGARVVPCSGTLRNTHPPHNWEPQPGMEPVRCPGARQDGAQP